LIITMKAEEPLTYAEALALHQELAESQKYNARQCEIIARLKRELADLDALRRQLDEKDRAINKRNARIKQLQAENARLRKELTTTASTPASYDDVVKALETSKGQAQSLKMAFELCALSLMGGGAGGGGGTD
jgi:hypothetical protein